MTLEELKRLTQVAQFIERSINQCSSQNADIKSNLTEAKAILTSIREETLRAHGL